jgi:hypothetical protein
MALPTGISVSISLIAGTLFAMLGYLNLTTTIYHLGSHSTTNIHDLVRKLTPCPNPRAVEDQNPRYDGQDRANAPQ